MTKFLPAECMEQLIDIVIHRDYFVESATYGFLFTSCKTLENEPSERNNRASEFSKVVQIVNKDLYKALSMLQFV